MKRTKYLICCLVLAALLCSISRVAFATDRSSVSSSSTVEADASSQGDALARTAVDNVMNSADKYGTTVSFFTDGIAVFCAVGSGIAWLFSHLNKKKAEEKAKEAKADADRAREYAENANQKNIAAKEYYERAVKILDAEEEERERTLQKQEIYKYLRSNGATRTKFIAEHMDMTEEELFPVLDEMLKVDGCLSAGGRVRLDNPSLNWTAVSKR